MNSPLSSNEREALTRFVAKLVDDVERVATLLEERGGDAALSRDAQSKLQRTLDNLQTVERFSIRLQARVSEEV